MWASDVLKALRVMDVLQASDGSIQTSGFVSQSLIVSTRTLCVRIRKATLQPRAPQMPCVPFLPVQPVRGPQVDSPIRALIDRPYRLSHRSDVHIHQPQYLLRPHCLWCRQASTQSSVSESTVDLILDRAALSIVHASPGRFRRCGGV